MAAFPLSAAALGLASAVFYGGSDLAARLAGRQVGTVRTILYGHGAASVLVGLAALASGWPHAAARVWGFAVLANLMALVATAALYRALAFGVLSIVSPLVALYGVVTALLSAASGEHLGLVAWLGLLTAAAGGALATCGPARVPAGQTSGAALALLAALLYGASFWLFGRNVVPVAGILAPTALYYAMGTLSALGLGLLLRAKLGPPRLPQVAATFGTTALACAGTLALSAGLRTGAIAVATVLSALASAVTVFLARVFLHEKVPAAAWGGLALIVLGLGLLHAG